MAMSPGIISRSGIKMTFSIMDVLEFEYACYCIRIFQYNRIERLKIV